MYHLLAILTVCIWGTTFVSTKILLSEGLAPADIFLLRFALAYVGMAAVHPRNWRCNTWRDEMLMVLAGLTGGSLYFLTENTALQLALAGNVSLVVCLAPLITVFFALISRSNEHPTARLWVGSLIALGGVAFVVGGDAGQNASHPLLGGVLALSAAGLWAVYQLIIKPLGDRYGAAMLTRKVFGYGLITILVYLLLIRLFPVTGCTDGTSVGMNLAILARPVVWGNLLFLGVVASLVCYFVWNKVVERLGSVVSANYIYLNPLTTCLFSALFLGEHLTLAMLTGGCAILSGVYLAVGRKKGNGRFLFGNRNGRI